jgi:hypothetical protein
MNVIGAEKIYGAALVDAVKASEGNNKSIVSSSWNQKKGEDNVSISAQGAMMSGLTGKLGIEGLFGYIPKIPGVINIEELEKYGRKFLHVYNTKLQNIFKESGIDSREPVDLKTAQDGSIVVANSHPDKIKIEKLFKENAELGNEYKKINNMLTMAAAGRESSKFQEAYAGNPKGAAAQYSHLFNTRLEGMMRISDKGAEIFFHREQKSR